MSVAKILCLENETLSVGVLPEVGGSIGFYRAKVGGVWIDVMRPATPTCIAAKDPLGVASFPLFPISNRIANAQFEHDGVMYRFKPNLPPEPHINHGDSWYKEWKVVRSTYECIELEHSTKSDDFPIKYRATQIFQLSDNGLIVDLSLTNLHNKKMPFGTGMHPYFPITPLTKITARTPYVWITGADAMPTNCIKTPAEWDMTSGLKVSSVSMDNCFVGGSPDVLIEWPEHKCGIKMTASDEMRNLVVYIPPHHNFFCAELVSNATGALNRLFSPHANDNLIWLDANQTYMGRQKFELVR